VRGSLIARVESSKDFKVAEGEDRSLQGSRTRNPVPPPTIEQEDELETGRGVLMKEKP
jgi:hypothetical protein